MIECKRVYKNVIFLYPDGKVKYLTYNEKEEQYRALGKKNLRITKDGVYSYVAEVIYEISKNVKCGMFSIAFFNGRLLVSYSSNGELIPKKDSISKEMINVFNHDCSEAEKVFIKEKEQYSKIKTNLWYSKTENEEVTEDMVFTAVYEKILTDFFEESICDEWYRSSKGKVFELV